MKVSAALVTSKLNSLILSSETNNYIMLTLER